MSTHISNEQYIVFSLRIPCGRIRVYAQGLWLARIYTHTLTHLLPCSLTTFLGLAQPITVDQVIGLFSPYGVVTYVRLLRDKVTKELTGSAMVEFKTEEGKAKYVP